MKTVLSPLKNNTGSKFGALLNKALCICVACVFAYLSLVSLFSTVYVSENEDVFYVKDNAFLNIIIIVLISLFCIFFKEKALKLISGNEKKMVMFNSLWLFILLACFVFFTKLYPLYDQAKIINTVRHLFSYDYSDFLPGGYMDTNSQQWGIMYYFYLLCKLTGSLNIPLIQLFNVVFLVLMNFYIYKISMQLFSEKYAALIHLAMCLFIQNWSYVTFVYGNLGSTCFGVIGLYYLIGFIREQSFKRRLGYAVIIGLTLSISILFKQNLIIFLVAAICVSIYGLITDKKASYVTVIAASLACFFLTSFIVSQITVNMTKMETQGIPATCYIAMGLMDNNTKGPGWYNGYNTETYMSSGCLTLKADNEAKKGIAASIDRFKNNPVNAISFFARKIITQWTEPTYESLYIMYGRDAIDEMPPWFLTIANPTERVNSYIRSVMNLIQLLIFFGAFLYFVLNKNHISTEKLVLPIVFIGGFLFHILWEAKSQYAIMYVIVIIPYSVVGFLTFLQGFGFKDKENATGFDRKKTSITVSAASIVIVVLVFIIPNESNPGKFIKPSYKTAEYNLATDASNNNYVTGKDLDRDYAAALKMRKYKMDGRFFVTPAADESLALSVDEDTDKVDFYENTGDILNSVIKFSDNEGNTFFRFQNTQKAMGILDDKVADGARIDEWDFYGDEGQKFVLTGDDVGGYEMHCGEFVVGRDENGLLLTKNDGIKVTFK